MAKSQRLTLSQVAAVFRLVREACELGEDAVAWRSHVLDRLDALVGSAMSIAFVANLPFDAARVTMSLFVGRQLDPHWVKYANCRDVRPDPCNAWIGLRLGRSFTEIRQKMCDERTWYGSEHFNEVLRPIHQDHYLVSIVALPDQRLVSTIGLIGRLGEPAFSERQRKLVELLHGELGRLWTTPPLSTGGIAPPLSRRLAQTLERLSSGDSEKQIASLLGLSQHTVHNYVKELHHRYSVSSLGELLAKSRPIRSFRPNLRLPSEGTTIAAP